MTSSWPLLSQDPKIASLEQRQYAIAHYLPLLINIWKAIEHQTQFKWKCTSYWRASPTHRTGAGLDIAPDISDKSSHLYAVNNFSDPVLYKRTALIRHLQMVAHSYSVPHYDLGIFIEPDHLHLQILTRAMVANPNGRIYVVKWKGPKMSYSDTNSRMRLPMLP